MQRSENVTRHRLSKLVKRWVIRALVSQGIKRGKNEKSGGLYDNIRNMEPNWINFIHN